MRELEKQIQTIANKTEYTHSAIFLANVSSIIPQMEASDKFIKASNAAASKNNAKTRLFQPSATKETKANVPAIHDDTPTIKM